jgi:peroxiredoxin
VICNREATSVEAAAQRWAGKVQFVGVAWSGNDDEFQRFIDNHGLTFPQLSDSPGAIYARFGIPAQPAFVVVDAAGEVETLFGAVDEALLDDIISGAIT